MSERWFLDRPEAHGCERRSSPSVAPAAALGIGLIVQPERELGAVSLFLLAVVAAAVVGGIRAGVGSSVLGFLALNYFFTEPLHTFRVGNRDDVVAIVVFLVVALVVGSVVARAVDERARATRREREARLLNLFATKALLGRADRTGAERPRDDVDRRDPLIDLRDRGAGGEPVRSSFVERRPGRPPATPSRSRSRVGELAYGTLTAAPSADARRPVGRGRAVARGRRPADRGDPRAGLAWTSGSAMRRFDAEKSQARAALFSSVTHDLRTPLASIKASVTSSSQEDVQLDPDQRLELLRTVVEETDRLNRLIGNIIELARVRAGASVPSKEPTALDEVVESVLHRMQPILGGSACGPSCATLRRWRRIRPDRPGR